MGDEQPKAATPAPAAAPAPAAPSQGQPSGKKSNAGLIIAIVLIVLVVLGAVGYFTSRYLAKKAGEKLTETILEGATGTDVDIDSSGDGATVNSNSGSISSGSKAKWPTTMPATVPEFTYGTITYSQNSSDESYKSWNVIYESVVSGAFEKYKAALLAKGWVEDSNMSVNDMQSISLSNDIYQCTFSVNTTESTASLIVSTK